MPARLILVGRVAGAFGVRGEIKITTYTDDPMALVGYRDLLREDNAPALTLTGGRPVKGGLVVRAREVETREQAQSLRGLQLFVRRERLPEPDADEFYLIDLIGLQARDADGAAIGAVKSVQNFGAGDLLEIAPADGAATWWLPFTLDAVPEVSIGGGWLTVVRPAEVEGEEDAT